MTTYTPSRSRAFSLIELLVVISIMAILLAIAIGSFTAASRSARNSKRRADMETLRQAMVVYKADTGAYPTSLAGVQAILEAGYVSPPFPTNPKGQNYITGVDGGGFTSTTQFCFCVATEGAKGNSDAACAWNPTGSFYCVKNP